MPPKISIIVPVLSADVERNRSLRYLFSRDSGVGELLASVRANVTLPHETILVVNNPDDAALVQLAQDRAYVDKSCINSVNVGVARAWNMGAMMAEGDVLCWSNDDVVIGKGALERMVEVLESSPDVGQVGAHGGRWHVSGPQAGTPGPRTGLERVEEADEISGYLFLTKRHVYEEVGGFDNAYTPAFFEEIDYSFRVRRAGYRCLVVPGVDVVHRKHHGVSAKRVDVSFLGRTEGTESITARNKRYFLSKWGEG